MPDSSTIKPAPAPDPDFDAIPGPDPNSPTFARDLSAFVRKILLASPSFPRLYADVVLRYAPNSRAAKILRPHYQEILEKVNMAIQQQKSRSCTHIKVTGVRCDSPSLRGEQFCYFHQRMHRGVRTPPQARLHPIALIEDGESIQAALMEVINALMRNTIDLKRANLILRALHIAVKNASRVHFGIYSSQSVREIPDYAPGHVATDTAVGTAAGSPARADSSDPDREAAISAEQREIAAALSIPPCDPAASQPPRVRTTAELIAAGKIHPPNPTERKSSDELLAEYYGYPDVASYKQAQAAGRLPNAHPVPSGIEAQISERKVCERKVSKGEVSKAGNPAPQAQVTSQGRVQITTQSGTHAQSSPDLKKKPPRGATGAAVPKQQKIASQSARRS